MLSDFAKIIIPAFVAAIVTGAMFALWVANRKRIAADTIGRAEEQAQRRARDAERQAANDRLEKELAGREKALSEREQRSAVAAARCDELVAQHKHELERVAGLTAEEAKELLIKQI